MSAATGRALLRVALVFVLGLVLTAIAVAPQLSARAGGEDYLLRVRPVDPIDPFRGAYVDLSYPDLRRLESPDDEQRGEVFVLVEERAAADGVLRVTGVSRTRPDHGLYLACDDRDWRLRCGIESLFLPQDEAASMETAVQSGRAWARVRIDDRGHAALMGVETR